jgi:hypothetical protein
LRPTPPSPEKVIHRWAARFPQIRSGQHMDNSLSQGGKERGGRSLMSSHCGRRGHREKTPSFNHGAGRSTRTEPEKMKRTAFGVPAPIRVLRVLRGQTSSSSVSMQRSAYCWKYTSTRSWTMTARSSFPSWLKSATAASRGSVPSLRRLRNVRSSKTCHRFPGTILRSRE